MAWLDANISPPPFLYQNDKTVHTVFEAALRLARDQPD